MSETPQEFAARYCPTLTYTVKKAHVDALRATYGQTLFYNGTLYRFTTKSLGAGWYSVTATEAK